MLSTSTIQTLTQLSYLIAAALFILGLKRMSSPVTAVSGVRWAGLGMLLATVATLAFVGVSASPFNLMLVVAAIAIGGIVAWVSGKRVAMTDMPQMIALYNGMGGGAAGAIAAVELLRGEHVVCRDVLRPRAPVLADCGKAVGGDGIRCFDHGKLRELGAPRRLSLQVGGRVSTHLYRSGCPRR